MDALGRLIDLIAAVVLMFLLPAVWLLWQKDFAERQQADILADNLASQICSFGYIDRQMYESLTGRLDASGKQYDVNISHTQRIYEPEYKNGSFTGHIMEYEAVSGTNEILGEIYGSGAYFFDIGDTVNITVSSKSEKPVFMFSDVPGGNGAYYSINRVIEGSNPLRLNGRQS